ncbi:hypothetical protein CFAM422_012987 [Trichoderma lentiforme]|uniref:Uncharacterized protein n=1 Tax=Trichoderma lentiforme TaxID=1567552 RepID=A0A9P4X312_9HYPO|nr:hypothetical protein CFAM422_012987 [Trichoderma lentiforme]
MIKNSSLSDGGDEILTSVKKHNECSDAAGFQELASTIAAVIGVDLKDIKVLTAKAHMETKAASI